MKAESLVIVYEYDAVNKKSNFAHTAHHARRVENKQIEKILEKGCMFFYWKNILRV